MIRVFRFAVCAASVLILLSSCKGRTMEDAEADGETVEVNIPEEMPDSASFVTPEDIDSVI